MFRRTLLASALALASTFAVAAPVTYTLDPGHTDVMIRWNHFGFSNPTANFTHIDGKLSFDEADPTKSAVDVTIPLSGLDSHVAKLDTHMKSADFFEADKYPNITFKSTKVQKGSGKNEFKVTGDLTVHGITKPVVLDATMNKMGVHPMSKAPTIGFDATTTIKRSEFGVGAYVPNVSDEIQIHITTEGAAAKTDTK